MATDVDTIERTSILVFSLLRELHGALASPGRSDDVTLGLLMGVTMHLDETIGPFRTKRLMSEAPTIVLQTDAHVSARQLERSIPALRAFGEHLRGHRGGGAGR